MDNALHYKDEILNALAEKGNVAQFISYNPNLKQRFIRLHNDVTIMLNWSIPDAISVLIAHSSEKRVNVRSFNPKEPKGHPFVYGLSNVDDVIEVLNKNSNAGLYSIVNETISVDDGGVSGVAMGGVIEFTPNDTPRGVEKGGACCMPRYLGLDMLRTVYGFTPELDYPQNIRVEFSIHPKRRGINKSNTIIWELETFNEIQNNQVNIEFPNNFSKLIGDKVFGLLIVDALGISQVPLTTVIPRNIAPFTFGEPTSINEYWIRTSPFERTSGKFSTFKGWRDPYLLLQKEDPENNKIASVLCQQAIDSMYSGSLITGKDGNPIIEGVSGDGDDFMLGIKEMEMIPEHVIENIKYTFSEMHKHLGAIEMEWVYDGDVWIVQLHKSKHSVSLGSIIVEGNPDEWVDFDAKNGLDKLRDLIAEIKTNQGINIIGNIGVTSHFGDVLRKANITSKITRIK